MADEPGGLFRYCDPDKAESDLLGQLSYKVFFASDFPNEEISSRFYPVAQLNSTLLKDHQNIDKIWYRIYRVEKFHSQLECRLNQIVIEFIGEVISKQDEGTSYEVWETKTVSRERVEKVLGKIISLNKLSGIIVLVHASH